MSYTLIGQAGGGWVRKICIWLPKIRSLQKSKETATDDLNHYGTRAGHLQEVWKLRLTSHLFPHTSLWAYPRGGGIMASPSLLFSKLHTEASHRQTLS